VLNLAAQKEATKQSECFIFYPPISCSPGNNVSQFNKRYIFIAT